MDRRQMNAVVGVAALVVLGVLLFFGLQLRDTQATSRQRTVTRFQERATLISALTQAIFSAAVSTPQAARQYGGAVVSGQTLDKTAAAGHLVYMALTDDRGKIIAASSGLTPVARAALSSRSGALHSTLQGAPVSLSDVLSDGPRGTKVIEYAVALKTAAGRRVLVSGAPLGVFSTFLGSYLRRVPAGSGVTSVLDSRGNVIGAADPHLVAGQPVAPALLKAIQSGSQGRYGSDGYFSAVDVPQTRWRVVLTQPQSTVFYSISGARKWTPWIIFSVLGCLAVGFLVLLSRLLANGAKLGLANRRLVSNNTKLESTNELLRHAAELARSNAELEQFASIASHDLQEPLRKVQTFAAQIEAMERDRLSEDGQDYLRRMSAAAGRMRTLIDDLLMFSRVSTQGRPFVEVDLNEVVAQVLVDLELVIEETGAKVTIDDLPAISADPVQMRQLMQNLLGNALKFRREDIAPQIGVRARVLDGIVELTVEDNGIGFDSQYAGRIFRAFERLHGIVDYPGTGIGLALCRKIVERHHGTITADSTIGGGSVFELRLPVEQPAGAADTDSLPAELIFDEASAVHA
jgi:signal transduction histidine kinase